MQPTFGPSPAPAKKSNTPMIVAVAAAAVLSLCCCLPGICYVFFPLNYSTTTNYFGDITKESGTLPAWYGIFCICAAFIPWLVVAIIALVRRMKK